MNGTALIPVDKITTHNRIRNIDPGQVASLKESILDVGLLNPITVCQSYEVFRLVAGAHRLEAYKQAGYSEIEARVVDLNDLERVLAECDENLCGPKLSASEKALFTAKRKEAYEAIHPDTTHGSNGSEAANIRWGNASRQLGDTHGADRFTANTAAATGQSERVVQRNAERGEKVIPEALELVRGTRLDTGAYLDKIKGLTPNDQVTAVRRDLSIQKTQEKQPERQPGRKNPSYEELRAAILFLCELQPDDFTRICPPNKRAAMCQKLAHLGQTFEQVREAVTV